MRPRGHKTAADAAGLTEAQQIAMQQQLFAEAKARSNSFQESQHSIAMEASHPSEVHPSYLQTEAPARLRQLHPHSASLEAVISTPSSIYTELAGRRDILPIHPLPTSPIASEFRPQIITSATLPMTATHPMECSEAEKVDVASSLQPQVLDFRHISMSQPVIVLHNGVQHLVSWQTLLSQVAMLPQFSQEQMENNAPGDFSLQMPVTMSHMPAMQPSFPESLHVESLAQSGAPVPIPLLHELSGSMPLLSGVSEAATAADMHHPSV